MAERYIFTVSELNQFIKDLLDNVPPLTDLLLRGEISNYKVYPSGHHYFTLKDSQCAVKCVLFKGSAMKLRFRPENGMQVIASGHISVYPRDGAYQLYCTGLSPDGVGDLSVAYEQLKEKLRLEGLFDEAHKKPLPLYPRRIAIVTSPAGAAVHDMIRILRRRYPVAKVLLLPVRVQGTEAPAETRRYRSSPPWDMSRMWPSAILWRTGGRPRPPTRRRLPCRTGWSCCAGWTARTAAWPGA